MEETLYHKTNSNFLVKERESGFGFCKEDNGVPHCKTLAQLTLSYSKTEKDASEKGPMVRIYT